jgi:hypothetical protein
MKPVQACSICGGAIVGFGNSAQPVCAAGQRWPLLFTHSVLEFLFE